MLKNILLSASLLALFSGCGTEPDTMWEVSRLDGMIPNSCYPNGTPPITVTTTMGVQKEYGPWRMYEGPEDKRYLVLGEGKQVIEGVKGEESYNFQWTETTTSRQGSPVTVTTVDTETNTIDFKIEKGLLTGTWEVKTTHTCTGGGCMGTLPNCTVNHQVKGRQLDIDRDVKVH